jgi:hypothetical protein
MAKEHEPAQNGRMDIKLSYDMVTALKAIELVSGIPPKEAIERALSIGLRAVVEQAEFTKPWQNAKPSKYWDRAFADLEAGAVLRSRVHPAISQTDATQ